VDGILSWLLLLLLLLLLAWMLRAGVGN